VLVHLDIRQLVERALWKLALPVFTRYAKVVCIAKSNYAVNLIMRLTIIILLLFPLLGAVSWAQTSSSMEASPNPVASPGAGQSGGIMGAPQPPGMAMRQP